MATIYPVLKEAQMGKAGAPAPVDFDTDPIYVMLVTSTYITGVSDATKKTHRFRSDVTGEVANGNGYTTGGKLLTSGTLLQSGDNWVYDAADPVWSASTITARGYVIFKRTGADLTTPADDVLIAWHDFGSDVTSTNDNFTVALDASGVVIFQ
jgi:hypothetical protein